MPDPTDNDAQPRDRSIAIALLLSGCVLAGVIGFASIGQGGPLLDRMIVILSELLGSGWAPSLYVLGGYGYGRMIMRKIRPDSEMHALSAAIGIAAMLTMTQILGIFGVLNEISAWMTSGCGVILALVQLRSIKIVDMVPRDRETITLLMPVAFGVGLLIVAASSPPGALWDSEFGAYDSLSYHLELPKEWIADGRVWPNAHNVYSYHPGYIESASVQFSLIAGKPSPLQSTHFFSVLLLVIAAWNSAIATSRLCTSTITPVLGAAMVLLTPWAIVVGTISYNECGVLALGAGALVVATDPRFSSRIRGILCGILVGAACGCKMTAIFFVAPTIAVFLFTSTPRRSWATLTMCGAFSGMILLAPWMIRNILANGNPVFPHAGSLFGSGHWTNEQLARFGAAHEFHGSVFDRIRMLVLPDPGAPPGIHVARFRGLTNVQWGLMPVATLISLVFLVRTRSTRALGIIMIGACVGPVFAWMTMTHLQSRFFVPMIPAAGMIIGVGAAHLASARQTRILATGLTASALLIAGVVFASQRQGHPNILLVVGASLNTDPIQIDGNTETLTWSASLNQILGPEETVYLLGDATPFYLDMRVVYNTTYDDPVIGGLIDQHPSDPEQWVRGLRDLGVDWVVINTGELARLDESGWIDPRISPQIIQELTDTLAEGGSYRLDPTRTAYRISETPTP